MPRVRRLTSWASAATLAIALLFMSLSAAAEQEPRVLAYVVSADELRAHKAPARAAVRSAFGAKRVWFLPEDTDCDFESDAACASALETKNRAVAIIVVRIIWKRAGCQPMRDSAGKVRGHRMLRRPGAEIIALSKGKLLEAVTVREEEGTSLDDEISRVVKEIAAKMARPPTKGPDGGPSS